ncbi:Cell division protein SepF [Aedoeadaptatus ivorii]|uniref:Cell division protein SepF n=1 Tax=Aedoeadaptatus ivorii TaxID=54006 RepID=A0A448V125_9FIRM|nr:cell division protein SepF [Peptoniphilus ivorii]MDQ0507729.1 cell division inhibitor SepF [Peptoniphilus ivorii]VEJ35495.1 Cell division protein SepF [Peptoniphilus ivorii]
MADFADKLKKAFGFGEDYEYDDEYEYDDDEKFQTTEVEPVTAQQVQKPVSSTTRRKDNGSVLSIQTKAAMVITVHEPLSYDESPKIVDDLKENKAVVLNFEQLDLEVKREIFDFVNGALYAIEGKIQKVNKDIFILAPNNIAIDGLKEELQNSGIFPW